MGAVGPRVRTAIEDAETTRAAATSGVLATFLVAFGTVQWIAFPDRPPVSVVDPALDLVAVLASVGGAVLVDAAWSDRRLSLPALGGSVLLGVAFTTAFVAEFVAQPLAFGVVFHGVAAVVGAACLAVAVDRWLGLVDEREAELRRQNERLDDFASVASHDLRSPLQVAHGSLVAVREDGDEAALDRLERSIDRMDAILDDVLEFSRIGTGSVETSSVRLSDVATEAWDAIQAEEATLRVEADGELVADSRLLQQALENLFRNAVDHGGDDVTVWIGTTTNGFYVMDDGPGIDSGQRDQVFDSGYSGGASTGLGLVIVSRIVEAHGWSIRTVTGHGGGARFEVRTE